MTDMYINVIYRLLEVSNLKCNSPIIDITKSRLYRYLNYQYRDRIRWLTRRTRQRVTCNSMCAFMVQLS